MTIFVYKKGRKHCGEMGKCLLPPFSSLCTFLKGSPKVYETEDYVVTKVKVGNSMNAIF